MTTAHHSKEPQAMTEEARHLITCAATLALLALYWFKVRR